MPVILCHCAVLGAMSLNTATHPAVPVANTIDPRPLANPSRGAQGGLITAVTPTGLTASVTPTEFTISSPDSLSHSLRII
ncbi:hypothetical protein B0H16DRAFT_1728293 [Mycena metata]|uniref:Secreted protein n=1 Tax=Mycena metata TaxID=1033252 RepID=A0AAD7N1V2_9AGAR|nr:hypothetical protein B0H16DRAFT_1728293 [Mycena metata]